MFIVSLMVNVYQQGCDEHDAVSVVVENERGSRWAHAHVFKGHELGREEAHAEGLRMMGRVALAMKEGRFRPPQFNPHWHAIQPCYGSPEYAREWQKWEALADLEEGNYDVGTRREWELREEASQ